MTSALCAVLLTAALGTSGSSAQTNEPYTSSTTPGTTAATSPPPGASCATGPSTTRFRAGDAVRIQGGGYTPGSEVQVTLGGQVVATGTADEFGCVDITFRVPDIAAGQYLLCIVGPGRSPDCHSVEVLAAGGEATGGSGSLARTGLDALPFVVGAVAAILLGRHLMMRSRRARHP